MVTRDRKLSRPFLLSVVFLRLWLSVCKDLVTTQVPSKNKYQVATKGSQPLRRRKYFSNIYGCPSYHKTGESY